MGSRSLPNIKRNEFDGRVGGSSSVARVENGIINSTHQRMGTSNPTEQDKRQRIFELESKYHELQSERHELESKLDESMRRFNILA